jgi:hypothetical protein
MHKAFKKLALFFLPARVSSQAALTFCLAVLHELPAGHRLPGVTVKSFQL